MKSFSHKGYTIEVFDDIKEWGITFYDMPENAVIEESFFKEFNNEISGFANIEDKIIHLFIYNKDDLIEIENTIAHEVGHIIEGGFKKSPPNKSRYDKRHELKANHYQDYYMLVRDIYELVIKNLN